MAARQVEVLLVFGGFDVDVGAEARLSTKMLISRKVIWEYIYKTFMLEDICCFSI